MKEEEEEEEIQDNGIEKECNIAYISIYYV